MGYPPAVSTRRRSIHRIGPWALVALVVAFNLWVLRAETTPVPNLNDGSVHRSMIGWAEQRWSDGHLPLDGWYPALALGSSRFHRYQSLPHVATGLVATVTGSDRAYSWSLYLLLASWPLSVFAGGRLLGLGRWRSAVAAAASPLIVSAPTLGYEWGSYAWRGYGTWTQLWGMWLLPLAWGFGYRAVSRGRASAWAALVIAMTIAVHLLTGYLALLSLGVVVLARPSRLLRRIGRAAWVAAGSLLIGAWVVVPLLLDRAYTIQDEFSRGKVFYDSFGAKQILAWMVSGRLFDRNRFPVLSILAGVGLLVCAVRWRRDERVRIVVGVGLLSLLLFFGRSTLGSALRILPGSGDLFLRRFVFGVHLAGLYLIGIGGAWLGGAIVRRARRRSVRLSRAIPAVGVALILVLAPAWVERAGWAAQGAEWIREQQVVDAADGADVAALVDVAMDRGPGRIYAGLRSNWGAEYRVGQVPLYAMLLNLDAEGIGFTRPTWSLAAPFEFRFQDRRLAHFDVFDVRYVIQPSDRDPPVGGELLTERGTHALWEIGVDGPIEVVDVAGVIEADRTNLGDRGETWWYSELPAEGVHPAIAFPGVAVPSGVGEATEEPPADPPGSVVEATATLADGVASATVDVARRSAVVLKASFDNRWRVTVDGIEVEPQMIAPALVGRVLEPGRHEVTFEYVAFPRYDALLLLGVLVFGGMFALQRRSTRRHPRGHREAERERHPDRVG